MSDPYFWPEAVRKRQSRWFGQGELHPFGFNYAGPGSEFEARQLGSDFYEHMMNRAGLRPIGTKPYNVPTDAADRAAYYHDAVYSSKNTTKAEADKADQDMLKYLNTAKTSSIPEAVRLWMVKKSMQAKTLLLPSGAFLGSKETP